jgi:hypothetical protein
LFAAYPLAVAASRGASLMTLILPGPVFGQIARWDTPAEDGTRYSLHDEAAESYTLDQVAEQGVPLPRHGSVFGWVHDEEIPALVVVYTETTPQRPEPRWTVMPLDGTPRDLWPPFTGRHLFSGWFWDYIAEGSLLPLGALIAATPGAVFWADTHDALGADCCVVTRDLSAGEGWLRAGVYAYSEVLRNGVPVPSAETLLRDALVTDLAPRFRRHL